MYSAVHIIATNKIRLENGKITLTPTNQAHCVICGEAGDIVCFDEGYTVCKTCLKAMVDQAKK